MIKNILISSLLLTIFGSRSFYADAKPEAASVVQEALQSSLSIELHLSRNPDDMKDARRRNIFTIYVMYPEHYKGNRAARFNILFYLDGRLDQTFHEQALPYVFTQNLRGQLSGRHEIRVDLQDATSSRTLASQTIMIDVAGAPSR